MIRNKILPFAALALLAACSSEQAHVELFEASPGSIQLGGSTTLLIGATNAQKAVIDNGVGDVSGQTQAVVSPTQTTIYTLTVTSKDGKTDTKSTTVTVVAAKAASYSVTLPASATAGTAVAATVTALGPDGSALAPFAGTVNLTTDDAQATVPATATIAAGSGGKATVQVTFKTAGAHALTAADATTASVRGTGSTAVKNAPASKLQLSGLPASAKAGDAIGVRVTALDAFGNLAVDYRGTVAITTNDASAIAGAAAAFTAGDNGVHSFGVTLATAKTTSITASDSALSASGSVAVANAAAARIAVSGPSETLAGDAQQIALIVQDRFGNTALDYTGTVHVTTSDTNAPAVADVAFAAADHGAKTVAVTLVTDSIATISATDAAASLTGSTAVHVSHKPATKYRLSALPSTATAGDPLALTVTALDASNNVVTDYAGVAHFSSADATDRLPADAAFANGVATVSLAFVKAGGGHAVTATEKNGTLTATSNAVTVSAAAAAALSLSGPSSLTAGAAGAFTLTATDRYGNTAVGYTGTIHVTSDSAGALPGDFAFAGGDAGVKQFQAALNAAGVHGVVATDAGNASLRGAANVTINPAAAASIALSQIPTSAAAGDSLPAVVTAFDAYGNVATGYAGTVSFSVNGDSQAMTPTAYAFQAGGQGKHSFSWSLRTVGSWKLTATDSAASFSSQGPAVAVAAGAASTFVFSNTPSSAIVGSPVSATVTAKDKWGNTATAYAGTVHAVLTDPAADAIADRDATSGVATIPFTFKTAGRQSLMVNDTATVSVANSTELSVTAAQATQLQLQSLQSLAMAGEPLSLVAVALDGFGNLDTGFNGVGHLSSVDPTDILEPDRAFAGGRLTIGLTFTKTGQHKVTLSQAGGTISADSTLVGVSADAATTLRVAGSGNAVAGAGASFTATALDQWGNTDPSYVGTVNFTATDAQFTSPGPYTFTAGDAGAHPFSAVFKTAGAVRLDARDTVKSSVAGGAQWTVAPAAAATCAIDQVPTAVSAGQLFALRVSVADAFVNRGTNYAGTIALTTTDPAGSIPQPSVAYSPAVDKGAHVYSLRFGTAGLQTVTATDSGNAAVTCSVQVQVYAPTTRYLVTLPANANFGAPALATITVQNGIGATITDYAGTVTFTSSDGQAALPAPVAFNGTQNGTATVSVTFNSIGAQTLIATEQNNPAVAGTGATTVRGLVYTDPSLGFGTVRVVYNAGASNPGVAQLDVVAAKIIPASYGAGMNVPVDTTRVIADTTPITDSPVFNTAGQGATKAVAAALATSGPAAGLFLTAVSQKNAGTGAKTTDTTINPNAVLYSMRLRLNPAAAPGVVFDGSALAAGFRAAVRDRLGNDTVSQTDIVLGKLEVK